MFFPYVVMYEKTQNAHCKHNLYRNDSIPSFLIHISG